MNKYKDIANSLFCRSHTVTNEAIIVGSLGSWGEALNDRVLRKIGITVKYAKLLKKLICSEVMK